MNVEHSGIHDALADHIDNALAEHGPTPLGVGWNSTASQIIRFEQLIKIVDQPGDFSINDLGCGYGALLDFLQPRFPVVSYSGYDVSAAMIAVAKARNANNALARFHLGSDPANPADYCVASGLFSLRLRQSESAWERYVLATLDVLDRSGRRGFAFNSLTRYSEPGKMRSDLYYPDPCALFDYCKRRYSRNVALLHDYDLYDFTILVRKGAA